LVSLLFSILHFWVEVMFIKIESIAFDTSMAYYSIVCFNGRFGWVPFAEKFNSVTCQQSSMIGTYDYDKLTVRMFKSKFALKYEFSNDTIEILEK